jgi:hypothetical protein
MIDTELLASIAQQMMSNMMADHSNSAEMTYSPASLSQSMRSTFGLQQT